MLDKKANFMIVCAKNAACEVVFTSLKYVRKNRTKMQYDNQSSIHRSDKILKFPRVRVFVLET